MAHNGLFPRRRSMPLALLAVPVLLGLPGRMDARAEDADLGTRAPQDLRGLPPQLFQEITADGTVFVDAQKALRTAYGPELERLPQAEISAAIVKLAEALPPSGAIDLPCSVPCGVLDFRRVANGVQITRGYGGKLILGGGQHNIQMVLMNLDQEIAAPLPRRRADGDAEPARQPPPVARVGSYEPSAPPGDWPEFKNVAIMEKEAKPAGNLLALFCGGGIHINNDVSHCAWICGNNAFGKKTVTASARVDHSLFLWFGINWAFADYNAHWDPKNAGRNWLDNAQMWFDCKGGGEGTRLCLMVETNYGNPGPGVVLENCTGMSLYNGTTERASSQGPGTYWLKNCRNVQVGLRGINAFAGWGKRGADPAHDITIEGGSGNILNAMRVWGHASGASGVNSDPELQVWMTSFEFETEGFEQDGVLRFCYTPKHQAPSEELAAKVRPEARARAENSLRERGLEATPERLAGMEKLVLSGRTLDAPGSATHEQTFVFGGVDLTQGPAKLPGGRKLPPPPSVPASDAPRVRRPLAFTQAADFGKALLEAGADPTGKTPSDDAFAKLMFGMTRDEVEKHYRQIVALGAQFEKAHAAGDKPAADAALKGINEAIDKLWPQSEKPGAKTKGRAERPKIDIPPGTFLVTRPILVWTNGWFVGAGPERTVIKAAGDFTLIKHIKVGTIGNFTLEGGHTGLAVTGADHGSPLPAPLKSYIAGGNYYNITFRNQSFAGLHLGCDDPEVMGGAEFDQNRFVDLKFYHTGDYGIYNNAHMLDKWLCLHGHFEGQRKAGIAIKFNCVIKGGIYGCTFRNIQGPGLDILSGSPELALRPSIVTVDQCEFVECGSAQAPAVDLGYNSLTMFTHSRVRTSEKQIMAGCIGAPQIMQDVEIAVNVPGGRPALILRAVRNTSEAQANGQVLRDVTASGPLAFIYDANDHNAIFEPTRVKRGIGKGKDINWDRNSALHRYPPPNGWLHPFVFYNCAFGEKKYAYSLLNVDPSNNRVLREVDLSQLAGK